MTKCIKTGCALRYRDQFFWGDAHLQLDTFIFVSTRDARGQAQVIPDSEFDWQRDPIFTAAADADVFERAGIFVIPFAQLSKNSVLGHYFRKWPI